MALSLLTSGAVPHPGFPGQLVGVWVFVLLPSCYSVILLSSFSTLTLCLDSWCEDGSEATQEKACDEEKKRGVSIVQQDHIVSRVAALSASKK